MTEEFTLEQYLKARLRDLGFAGMSCREMGEKVLAEYRAGWRGITSFYCEQHRVLLGPRVFRYYYKGCNTDAFIRKASDGVIDLDMLVQLQKNTEEERPAKAQQSPRRQRKSLRRYRTWKRCTR